jgi:RNA polymerase sigma factor (sigma-70 family)
MTSVVPVGALLRTRARTADEEFAEAYPALFHASLRLAHRMTRDPGLSEEIAAETLARAYARWGQVRDAASPTAWVQRVTANLVIDGARRRRVATEAVPLLAADDDLLHIEDQVTLRLVLVAALATLPRKQREALVLRYLAGVEEPELSRTLGTSPSSARTHVQRGLAALRRRLTPPEGVSPLAL